MRLLTLSLLCAGTVTDLKRREVPDAVPILLAATAILAMAVGRSAVGWSQALQGSAAGIAVGALFFWRGVLGGGDVKIVAALGLGLGPSALFSVLFYTVLAGGAVALAAVARGARELPYMPAITAGYAAAWALEGRW